MPFQPAMEEPSNILPSRKKPSSTSLAGMVTCCSLPRVSVKRRSANLTSFSFMSLRTSLGVISPPEIVARVSGVRSSSGSLQKPCQFGASKNQALASEAVRNRLMIVRVRVWPHRYRAANCTDPGRAFIARSWGGRRRLGLDILRAISFGRLVLRRGVSRARTARPCWHADHRIAVLYRVFLRLDLPLYGPVRRRRRIPAVQAALCLRAHLGLRAAARAGRNMRPAVHDRRT